MIHLQRNTEKWEIDEAMIILLPRVNKNGIHLCQEYSKRKKSQQHKTHQTCLSVCGDYLFIIAKKI